MLGVDFLCLAKLAKVVVGANGAVVADASDWFYTASITYVGSVVLNILGGSFLDHILIEKHSERFCAEILNFFFHKSDHFT
jgi:hypothetical protein